MKMRDIIKKYISLPSLLIVVLIYQVSGQSPSSGKILTGADQMDLYLPLLKGKKIGILVNQTSIVEDTHLLDTLIARGASVTKIFAPEHGFRGNQANGETVLDGKDIKTGLPIISLYGKNKKPSTDQLAGLDLVIYDIQDVGARFYTYISSMHYMMQACLENQISFLILDRPNPNAHFIDGPILEMEFQSFVGMHPIPVVHALTSGELAKMIIGEEWIQNGEELDLKIIEIKNWKHSDPYSLSISPSPNLPNDQSINLYPSLCLFEGTKVSIGRGTPWPFQILGIPDTDQSRPFSFTPVSSPGFSLHPKHEDVKCYGLDLRKSERLTELNLDYLIDFYRRSPDEFFNPFFTKLAGTKTLEEQIKTGLPSEQIRDSWQEDLNQYKKIRQKYLLYED